MIQDTSSECTLGGCDIFTTPPTQTAVIGRTKIDFHNVANLSEGAPIEFVIPATDEDYWDLNQHVLEVRCKIFKSDGGVLADDDKVGFVNFPLQALFAQIDLHVNGELVTTSANTYPYRAYLEKILTYSTETLNCQFSSELFAQDTAGSMNALDGTNEGLAERTVYTAKSKEVILRGSLHIPLLMQERHLINQCSMKLTLIPSNNKFHLMAAEDKYKVKVTSARFELMKLKMNPDVINEHNMRLIKQNAIYPIRHGEIKTFSIPAGSMQVTKESLFHGKIPRRLIIGLVSSSAFSGNVKENPFNFQHFNLSSICCFSEGIRKPNRALTPDFENGHYVESFQSLFTGNGMTNDDRSLCINIDEFAKGYTLFVIQLSPGEPDSANYDLIQRGAIRLEMKFKVALPATATAIVYAEYEGQIEITRDRSIIQEK